MFLKKAVVSATFCQNWYLSAFRVILFITKWVRIIKNFFQKMALKLVGKFESSYFLWGSQKNRAPPPSISSNSPWKFKNYQMLPPSPVVPSPKNSKTCITLKKSWLLWVGTISANIFKVINAAAGNFSRHTKRLFYCLRFESFAFYFNSCL